jgi:hypothetical protein
MSDVTVKIGQAINTQVKRVFGEIPGYDRVQKLYLAGNVDEANTLFNEVVVANGPVSGLTAAIESAFAEANPTIIDRVRESMRGADYDAVVESIASLALGENSLPIYTFSCETTEVAHRLVGSVWNYAPTYEDEKKAVITHAAAWKLIGGSDQTIPQAEPGTAGVYTTTGARGTTVGIVAAHELGKTGIVAIYGMKPIVDGRMRAAVTGKKKVAEALGFMDPQVQGAIVDDLGTPAVVDWRKSGGNTFTIGGKQYTVERVDAPTSGNKKLLAEYKLAGPLRS